MYTNKTASKRDPQRGLQNGISATERGRAKLVETLCWLYKWHVTVAPLSREFLGTTETNYLAQLERKGLVKSFLAPSLICGRGYMLSGDGVNAAVAALGHELPYSVHPASVSHVLLKHNMAVQRVCIEPHRQGHIVTPGRFLTSARDGKIPDALIANGDEIYAVEVELSGKWSNELEQALNAHLKSLREETWQKVAYVSNSQKLLERYKKRLEFPIADWWQTNLSDGSKRWIKGEPREITDEERAKFIWSHQPNLLKGFEMIKHSAS